MNNKQVLVWRKDLRNSDNHKVRTGKIAAQLAHAAMKVFFDNIESCENGVMTINNITPQMEEWIKGIFTKICVTVDSEAELQSIYEQAIAADLPCSLIQDAGLTEFGGVLTYTAVAIGPDDADKINKITGHLKLL